MATWALLVTTPKAVVTAQPKSAAASRSKPAGTFVRRFSETIACSLNVVTQPALTRPIRDSYTGVTDSSPVPFRQ